MSNHLGNAIRSIREQREIDQESLGESIGCTRATISHYESGKRVVPTKKIKGIAKHLEVDPIDLLEIRMAEAISSIIDEFKRST